MKDNNDEAAALASSYSEHIKSEKKFWFERIFSINKYYNELQQFKFTLAFWKYSLLLRLLLEVSKNMLPVENMGSMAFWASGPLKH